MSLSRLLDVLLVALVVGLPLAAAAQVPTATPASVLPVAKAGVQRVDAVEAEMVADVSRAVPGQPFRIALRLKHDPHWHTYWRNPGDSGLPTRFEPGGPAGSTYDEIVWPAPKRLAIGDLANYGYEDEVLLSRQVRLPSAFSEATARFEVTAQWLVCKDVCIPGEAALALDIPVGAPVAPAADRLVALFDESAKQAPAASARMQSGWWQQGTQAILVLPDGIRASRAEFFPYFEGVVKPSAAQSLTDGSAQALHLVTVPAPGEDAPSALPVPAAGLLLADGRPLEISLRLLDDAPSAGSVISVAEVVPAVPAGSQSFLDRLRGPVGVTTSVGVPASVGTAQAPGSPAAGAASTTLALALIGALIGGLILNLMPCVFPVIGLKVLSFARSAGGDVRVARRNAWSFSAGVVLSFLVLGATLLVLRSAGEAAGWGFQMQSPLFVGAMALLFLLIGLNLFGVFETGISLTRLDAGTGSRGLSNSFWTGVVAVLVATPCTAPFMGSAVGFTISSPPGQTLLVFAALGIGMAIPYLLLGMAPRLLGWLPRPGPWLLTFKQLLAFPILATAAWLAWVLTLQAGADAMLRLLMSAVLVAFAAWVYGRAQVARLAGVSGRGRGGVVAACLAAGVVVWQLAQIAELPPPSAASTGAPATLAETSDAPSSVRSGRGSSARAAGAQATRDGFGFSSAVWQPWSAERVEQALAQGRPVLVDFTAAWCISCQANKKLVLEREVVRRAFDTSGVALLRADWTSRDAAITAELARFGRNGVPLYLVYSAVDQPPLILPELLSVDVVLAALGTSR